MLFSESEIDSFFDMVLAMNAIYISQEGVSKTIKVIFDRQYTVAGVIGEVDIQSASPVAHCKKSDVLGVRQGDILRLLGTIYYIVEIQDFGTGIVTLVLSENE